MHEIARRSALSFCAVCVIFNLVIFSTLVAGGFSEAALGYARIFLVTWGILLAITTIGGTCFEKRRENR